MGSKVLSLKAYTKQACLVWQIPRTLEELELRHTFAAEMYDILHCTLADFNALGVGSVGLCHLLPDNDEDVLSICVPALSCGKHCMKPASSCRRGHPYIDFNA